MKKIAVAIAFLVGTIAMSGCGTNTASIRSLDASWAVIYHDLGSLKKASDVVVHGTIVGVAQQTTVDKIPFTDFNVDSTNKIYDPRHLFASTTTNFILHQTGGTIGNTLSEVEDDPLFIKGEEIIVFLHEYSPGHYFVVGGPSGRFEVHSGKVSPINNEGVHLSNSPSVREFAALVQQANE